MTESTAGAYPAGGAFTARAAITVAWSTACTRALHIDRRELDLMVLRWAEIVL